MRATRGLIGAFVFVVGTLACSSDAPGTRFRSRIYGYSIDLPSGWTAIPAERALDPGEQPLTGTGGTDVMARHANRKVSAMELPALVVGGQPVTAGTSLDDWQDRVVDTVLRQKGCAEPDRSERVQVGDDDAVLLVYRDCPRGAGLYHAWIAVVHGNRGFHFVWFNVSAEQAEDRAVLDQVLASVSFSRAAS